MSNKSQGKADGSTSSGHGALGMGGQPTDDPRDLNSGGGDDLDDDRGGGTGPIPGAKGGARGDTSAGNVAGVKGDASLEQDIEKEAGTAGR